MPPEFGSHFSETTVTSATQAIEAELKRSGSVARYIETVQSRYESTDAGKTELGQLVRAAQFITQSEPDDFGEKVQAWYHGELIAMELLRHTNPDTEQKFGLAESYISRKIDQVRYNPETGKLRSSMEDTDEAVSRAIQIELAVVSLAASLPEQCEDYIHKLSHQMSGELHLQHLTMMGYRMIMHEATKPLVLEDTHDAAELIEQSSIETQPSVSRESFIPNISLAAFRKIFEEPTEPEWASRNVATKQLLKLYKELSKKIKAIQSAGATNNVASRSLIETRLQMYNRTHDFFKATDLLQVTGELLAISSNGSYDSTAHPFDPNSEIRGLFGGIVVIEAPSNKDFLNSASHPNRRRTGAWIETPAIRILNPVVVEYTSRETYTTHNRDEEYFDIPLVYKRVSVEKLDDLI